MVWHSAKGIKDLLPHIHTCGGLKKEWECMKVEERLAGIYPGSSISLCKDCKILFLTA